MAWYPRNLNLESKMKFFRTFTLFTLFMLGLAISTEALQTLLEHEAVTGFFPFNILLIMVIITGILNDTWSHLLVALACIITVCLMVIYHILTDSSHSYLPSTILSLSTLTYVGLRVREMRMLTQQET